MWIFSHRSSDADAAEREKLARLEKAEGELSHLKKRATSARQVLDDRNRRNHWRESIEIMITGGI